MAFSRGLAVGASVAIVTATSMIGLTVHLADGRLLDLSLTAAMAASCVVGAVAGEAVTGRASHERLAQAFAVVSCPSRDTSSSPQRAEPSGVFRGLVAGVARMAARPGPATLPA